MESWSCGAVPGTQICLWEQEMPGGMGAQCPLCRDLKGCAAITKWESCVLTNNSIPHLCLAPEVQQRASTASVALPPSLPGDDQSKHRLLKSLGLTALQIPGLLDSVEMGVPGGFVELQEWLELGWELHSAPGAALTSAWAFCACVLLSI